jgi:hypothetical protein
MAVGSGQWAVGGSLGELAEGLVLGHCLARPALAGGREVG